MQLIGEADFLFDPRIGQAKMLQFFGGLNVEGTNGISKVLAESVNHEWQMARKRARSELKGMPVDPEHRCQIERLYRAALQRAAHLRPEFVETACAGDAGLRQEVESLLAQSEEGNQVSEEKVFDSATERMGSTTSALPTAPMAEVLSESPKQIKDSVDARGHAVSIDSLIGHTISRYRLLRKLGHGGMGVVYEADDLRLRRRVALKFLSEDRANAPTARLRFEREDLSVS